VKKKVRLIPLMFTSMISGKEFVEKALIADKGYPETLVHLDFFEGGVVYDELRSGRSVDAWIQITDYEPEDREGGY
jgi:hypothetical protein